MVLRINPKKSSFLEQNAEYNPSSPLVRLRWTLHYLV